MRLPGEQVRTVLLSYPRSGNTWLRYCIEFLTKCPSGFSAAKFPVGRVLGSFVDLGVDLKAGRIVRKEHSTESVAPDDRLLFILRDYKECLLSHRREHSNESLDWLIDCNSSDRSSQNYSQLIEFYDRFEGAKELLHYEDLIEDLEGCLRKSLAFLGYEDTFLAELLRDVDRHRRACLELYQVGMSGGQTTRFHARRMRPISRRAWDEYLKRQYPELFARYLERYVEDASRSADS